MRAMTGVRAGLAVLLATAALAGTSGSAHAAGGGGVGDQVDGSSANGTIAVSVTLTGSAVGNGGTTSTGGPGGGGGTTVYTPPACYWDSLGGAYTGATMFQRLEANGPEWYTGAENAFLPNSESVTAHKDDDGVWYTIAAGPNSNIKDGPGASWDDVTSACMSKLRTAAGPGANGGNAGYIFVPAGTAPPAPLPAPPTPEQLRDAAYAALTLPVPALGRNPTTTTLVGLPTWFWVPAGDFRTWDITASAGTPVVSATVVAQPQSMVVSSAGGTSGACSPAQSVQSWTSGASDDSACTISFERSSVGQPGLAYAANGTTSYTTSWTSTVGGGAGPGGALAPAFRTGQTQVPVAEVQALVTGSN